MKYAAAFILALSLISWRIFTSIPGERDPYYLKFTSAQYRGLVIGSSRAGQGIIPSRLGPDIYNYSFNSIISPYGPAYTRAIRKKLSPQAKGPFIIELNPSQLALSSLRERPDVITFPEDSGFLNTMMFFNLTPNLEYVIRSRQVPFYKSVEANREVRLHADGWLETPSLSAKKRETRKMWVVQSYERMFPHNPLSEKRIRELKNLVEFLKLRGKVIFVRLPTSPEVKAVENRFHPGFDRTAEKLSEELAVKYLNYFELDLETKDGDHLTEASAIKITELISKEL